MSALGAHTTGTRYSKKYGCREVTENIPAPILDSHRSRRRDDGGSLFFGFLFSFCHSSDTDVFLSQLSGIPGITESVAQWVAVRALREPDAFPSADRDLALSLGLASSMEFEQRSLAWRPWRAYAAIYLRTFSSDFGVLGNPSASSVRKRASGKTILPARIRAAVRRAS